MNTTSLKYKHFILGILISLISFLSFSQAEISTWKAQIAFGINAPSESGFVEPFLAKSVNFPTINIGVQRMFTRQLGAKLDFGYNRFSQESSSPEFKVNYTRINAQVIYDTTNKIHFLPPAIGIVGHVGPGFTFVKPLGNYPDNKISFFNVMTGIEFHYNVARTFSVFLDTSYIFAFAKDFIPVSDGFGSFNGDILTITVGVSISLSGCYFCE